MDRPSDRSALESPAAPEERTFRQPPRLPAWRDWLYRACFYMVSATMVLAALPTLLMPRGGIVWVVRQYGRTIGILLRVITGVTMEVRGREHLPDGPVLIAAKHQSTWETAILPLLFVDPAVVLKRELMQIPVWGWLARKHGMLPVERDSRSRNALLGLMRSVKALDPRDRPVIIFPQGTRLVPGREAAYLPGVGALYDILKRPVVPVALNSGCFWPSRGPMRGPGRIVLEILPAIEPGLPRDSFMDRLRQSIEPATARLEREAAGMSERREE